MELWLDTIDHKAIERAKDLGFLHGVTTNPSLLAAANTPAERTLEELLNHFSGPLAVQVTLTSGSEMVEQGRDLYDFSPRIVVKIPVTEEGIQAISRLNHSEIPTMATAVYTPMQTFLAAKAGARYIAPYFSELGESPLAVVTLMNQLLEQNGSSSKLLIASIKKSEEVQQCAVQGFSAATLSPSVFQQCLETPPQMLQKLKRFEEDWNQGPPSNLLTTRQFVG